MYSGTLAAALEGRHLGLPAIAVSLDGRLHYETAARVVCDLIPKLHPQLLNKREVININVPDLPYEELKGIKVCHLGYRSSAAEVIKQEDPRGEHIYWIGPSGLPEYDGEGTDFHAVKMVMLLLRQFKRILQRISQLLLYKLGWKVNNVPF